MRTQDKYYESGIKSNWRRTAWNSIAGRVRDKKNARVLYLPASKDLDRRVAVSKGFRPNNLIGIERDKSVVKQLRAENKLCIHGSAMDILAAWPSSSPVDVVFLDLTGPLTSEVFTKAYTLSMSPAVHEKTVIALNLLHGREPKHDTDFLKNLKEKYRADTIHRGELYFIALFDEWVDEIAVENGQSVGGVPTPRLQENFLLWMKNELNPWFDQYKSDAGNQYFDTLVYNNRLTSSVGNSSSEEWRKDIILNNKKVRKAVNNIRNVLAIQQMRKSGTLKSCPRW